tara:strand:+ start:5473 stop:6105 length:633 start_codon:yes stop_codon:yes gene_type:complete
MKSSEMLNQIKTLLNIEVKFEEMKLENGTVVEAESFEKGKEIFIKTDDEKVAMPVGEYILEDSRLLVIEEEGIIADMREVSDEVPEKESAEEEEITEDLKDEEYKEEDEEDEDKKKYEDDEADVGDWKGMEKRIKNLEDAIADLKSRFSDKEEMGEDNKGLKSRTVKEEFSEAAVKPIKHNPEIKEVEKRVFAKSKTRTTLDRVLNKLNK